MTNAESFAKKRQYMFTTKEQCEQFKYAVRKSAHGSYFEGIPCGAYLYIAPWMIEETDKIAKCFDPEVKITVGE